MYSEAKGKTQKCICFIIVACHMSEKGPRCFRRGKSNLKTVLKSLQCALLEYVCCPKFFFGYQNVFEIC